MPRDPEYLYGDSTPSSLRTDFISFLHDVLDFAVEVMLEEGKAQDAQFHAAQLADRNDREIERAEKLAVEIGGAMDRATAAEGSESESLAARCANRIRRDVQAIVSAESDALRAAAAEEKQRAAQRQASARAACQKALQDLLVRQDLPDASAEIIVELGSAGGYEARLHGHTPYGLHWVMSLEIDPSHPFARVFRIDRAVGRLSVTAPQTVGWLRKRVKLLPQRLDRLFVRALRVEEGSMTVELRKKPEAASPGFDLRFRDEVARVEIVRVLAGDLTPDAPHAASPEDAAKLDSLRSELTAIATSLQAHRRTLLEARLDETALERLEAPRALLERLFASLAPTVQEIARRSLVPGELVLKRVLGDNRREEVFASRAALRAKLEPLPSALRSVFDPLRLWNEEPKSPSAVGAAESAPVVASRGSDVPPPLFATGSAAQLMTTTLPMPTTVVPEAAALGALGKSPPHLAPGHGRADSTGKWPALRS